MTSFGRPISNRRGRARYSLVLMTLCGVSALGRSRGWSTRMTQPVMDGSPSGRGKSGAARPIMRSRSSTARIVIAGKRNNWRLRRPQCPPSKPILRFGSQVGCRRGSDRAASPSAARRRDRHNSRGVCRTADSLTSRNAQWPGIVLVDFDPHRPRPRRLAACLRRRQEAAARCRGRPICGAHCDRVKPRQLRTRAIKHQHIAGKLAAGSSATISVTLAALERRESGESCAATGDRW